jgi:hypothetical protein
MLIPRWLRVPLAARAETRAPARQRPPPLLTATCPGWSSGRAPPEGETPPRGRPLACRSLDLGRDPPRLAQGRNPWLRAASRCRPARRRAGLFAPRRPGRSLGLGSRPFRFAGPAPRPPLAGLPPGRSPNTNRSAAAAPSGNGAATHQRLAAPKCDRLPGARPLRWSPDPGRHASPPFVPKHARRAAAATAPPSDGSCLHPATPVRRSTRLRWSSDRTRQPRDPVHCRFPAARAEARLPGPLWWQSLGMMDLFPRSQRLAEARPCRQVRLSAGSAGPVVLRPPARGPPCAAMAIRARGPKSAGVEWYRDVRFPWGHGSSGLPLRRAETRLRGLPGLPCQSRQPRWPVPDPTWGPKPSRPAWPDRVRGPKPSSLVWSGPDPGAEALVSCPVRALALSGSEAPRPLHRPVPKHRSVKGRVAPRRSGVTSALPSWSTLHRSAVTPAGPRPKPVSAKVPPFPQATPGADARATDPPKWVVGPDLRSPCRSVDAGGLSDLSAAGPKSCRAPASGPPAPRSTRRSRPAPRAGAEAPSRQPGATAGQPRDLGGSPSPARHAEACRTGAVSPPLPRTAYRTVQHPPPHPAEAVCCRGCRVRSPVVWV